MASISQLNHFPCKTLSMITPPTNSKTPPSLISIPTNTNKPNTPVFNWSALAVKAPSRRAALTARAVEEEGETAVVDAEAEAEEAVELTEVDKLKKQLVDSFYGTDRGLSATSETRAEILELISKLEAINPNPAPTDALSLLNGKWILAYTSFAGLFPLLSRATARLVRVEEISQTIDSEALTVENSVTFAGPLATTSLTTNAKFEVRSPKRVQIKFEGGMIGTPQLTDSLELPENVEFLGQKIDLTPFKGIITSVQDTASSVAKTISSQPPLKFSLPTNNAESWLLTTFLDEELRISRGDGGSVFVLIKEVSSLLK